MIDNIDLTKYKRLFTIGCSFTQYWYPTWANVLSKSMPNAEFYNLGLSGASNPVIANRMAEANLKFKFRETDLVVIMWSTTCRESHYVRGRWYNPGNIYTQGEYSKEFVDKFADPDGYLIRDLATIEMATAYVNNLPCDYIGLLSTPIEYSYHGGDNPKWNDPTWNDKLTNNILKTYQKVISTFPVSLYELEMESKWICGSTYKGDSFDGVRDDYHPSTERYCNYLIKLGFPIAKEVIDYAKESTETLKNIKHRNDFIAEFPYCHFHTVNGLW